MDMASLWRRRRFLGVTDLATCVRQGIGLALFRSVRAKMKYSSAVSSDRGKSRKVCGLATIAAREWLQPGRACFGCSFVTAQHCCGCGHLQRCQAQAILMQELAVHRDLRLQAQEMAAVRLTLTSTYIVLHAGSLLGAFQHPPEAYERTPVS